MSDYSYGFDDFEKMIDEVMEIMPKAADSIVKEIGLEVLSEAIDNVNGPKNQNIMNKKKSSKRITKLGKKNLMAGLLAISAGHRYGLDAGIRVRRAYSQPYPVSNNTDTLRGSLELKKLGNAKYKVFADIQKANYAHWVHDGTSRLRPRPFLKDAVKSVINSGRYVEIANEVLEEFLGGL